MIISDTLNESIINFDNVSRIWRPTRYLVFYFDSQNSLDKVHTTRLIFEDEDKAIEAFNLIISSIIHNRDHVELEVLDRYEEPPQTSGKYAGFM